MIREDDDFYTTTELDLLIAHWWNSARGTRGGRTAGGEAAWILRIQRSGGRLWQRRGRVYTISLLYRQLNCLHRAADDIGYCIRSRPDKARFLYTSLFTKQVAQNNKTHKYSNLKKNHNLTKRT